MAVTPIRKRIVLTITVAAAAVSLSACTAVVDGAAVAGDRGPCTHVAAPMLDIPAGSSSEPMMRIPELPGWDRDAEAEDADPNVRLALSDDDENVIAVMVQETPDQDAQTIFDSFEAGVIEGLEQQGLPTEVTRTSHTLCGLPSETVTFGVSDTSSDSADTLAVVGESGGDTYLIAVVQGVDPHNPARLREAEKILSGFEVLPVDAAEA